MTKIKTFLVKTDKAIGCAAILLALLMLPQTVAAQSERMTRGGLSLAFEGEKDLSSLLSLGFDEEVRLVSNPTGFDRSVSSVGLNYALFNKRVKVGGYYAFIYLYNSKHLYEARNRFYFNLSYKQPLNRFTLSWRGRAQATVRDENRGDYRVNPRYTMKNKIELEYQVWGKPWKPYVSLDFSTNLNDYVTRYDLERVRTQAGAVWRLDRTRYFDFFVRWDEYLKSDDPRVIYAGAAFKVKF
jgi:hypothetical protein